MTSSVSTVGSASGPAQETVCFSNISAINLDSIDVNSAPWTDMELLWEAHRPWLLARGYKLSRMFELVRDGRWYPPPISTNAPLPYATCIRDPLKPSGPEPFPYHIAPAQDAFGRDVVLKLTDKNSAEYMINQTLLRGIKDEWQCVLPPVAMLDTPHHFSFIVMPRWGKCGAVVEFEAVSDVMQMIWCLLKGLTFLHSQRIAHRDIADQNFLVNCYCPGQSISEPVLRDRRANFDAIYSIFDFNWSIQLPHDASLTHTRYSTDGMMALPRYRPDDFSLGEHEYNPFAFDVGCLGNMFKYHFSSVVPMIPALAPLLDRMTTHVVSQRLSAADALAIAGDIISVLPNEVYYAQVKLVANPSFMQEPSLYWSRLPEEHSALWKSYRTPAYPPTKRMLQWIAQYSVGWRLLRFVRRILRM